MGVEPLAGLRLFADHPFLPLFFAFAQTVSVFERAGRVPTSARDTVPFGTPLQAAGEKTRLRGPAVCPAYAPAGALDQAVLAGRALSILGHQRRTQYEKS
jgi:hypothetical protein